jgi:hypothetical protein
MKRIANFVVCATVAILTASAQQPMRVKSQTVKPTAPMLKAVAPLTATSGINTLFTADVPSAHATAWLENFDNGISGWTVSDNTSYVEWTAKATTGTKAFTTIDATDVKSLYISGPYQTYRREISSLTSSKVSVPAGGALEYWVGFAQNYDTYCRLILSVSDDGFTTSTDVWNSKDETGEVTWRWHQVNVDLDNWSGKEVQFRLTYSWGSGDETFKTGGYFGDFYVDNIKLSSYAAVDNVSVKSGETVTFIPLVEADSYTWDFGANAVPSTSTEKRPAVYYTAPGNYDVTLTTPAASYTQKAMVEVDGVAPTAHIGMPATFRYATNHRYMVAPMVGVKYTDASEGFPTSRKWTFTGVNEDQTTYTTTEENPTVGYAYLHNWDVNLEVANSKGTSTDKKEVAVEYEGVVSNWQDGDYITYFDMDDWGEFPGSTASKVKMTKYAEHFSAPSRPVTVDGVYLYFTKDKISSYDTASLIQDIGVHLCKNNNGVPGEKIESWWWQCNELDYTSDGTTSCWFPFSYSYTDDDGTTYTQMPPVVNDEFFIMVDGFPEANDSTQVTLGMAAWRNNGNTAWLYKNNEWKSAKSYFGDNRQTSLAVMPYITHSVMSLYPASATNEVEFGSNGGTKSVAFYSYLGWKSAVDSDADWCRITNTPNGYTLDELSIECDAYSGTTPREAHLTLTDTYGADTFTITVMQSTTSGIADVAVDTTPLTAVNNGNGTLSVTFPKGTKALSLTDISGRLMVNVTPAADSTSATINVNGLQSGVYILFSPKSSLKVKL